MLLINLPHELLILISQHLTIKNKIKLSKINDELFNIMNDWQIWLNIDKNMLKLIYNNYFELITPNYTNYIEFIDNNKIKISEKLYEIYKSNNMINNDIFLLALEFGLKCPCEFNTNKIDSITIYNNTIPIQCINLSLSLNQITKIENLDNLHSLQFKDISNNPIIN